jgi:hypothetical protein
MTIAAYHLPPGISGWAIEPLAIGAVTLEVPAVTPGLLGTCVRHLERARERLRSRSPEEIAEVLAEASHRWSDRAEPLRQLAEATLPAITRFSAPMVAHGLDLFSAGFGADALRALLERRGDEQVLETFVPVGPHRSRAYRPDLTAHVLAGNIPGIGIPGVVAALLLGSANLVKTAAGDPLFPAIWAASVAKADSDLGECLAVLPWRGGRTDLESVVFDRADAVVAYGSDETIRELQRRVRSRFLGHGHRISVGVIGRDGLGNASEVAGRAAYDASLFDQQGCLSPHLFYVEEGGPVRPKEFAGLLAAAMARWAERLPPGSLTAAEAVAVRTYRATYEARGLDGKDVALFASPHGLDWAVIFDGDPAFAASCLHRTVLVKPVSDLTEVERLLQPWRAHLQAAAVAVAPERIGMMADTLGRAGVSRICPIGRMQAPPLTWHQDGRFLLRDLLRWVDLEIEPIGE